MTSFKIVAVAIGMVLTLGCINASAIPGQLSWEFNPAVTENDEGQFQMADYQTLLQIVESLMDSKMTLPPSCKCEGTSCNCCKTIKIFKWKKSACVEVQYKKEESSFDIQVKSGSRVLFSGKKPASDSPPVCFKNRHMPGVKFCVDVKDFKSEGDKTHGCVSVSAKLLAKTVAYQMGCFDMTTPQNKAQELTYYYPGPGKEANREEPSTGWRNTKENAPFPEEESYLSAWVYDE